MGRGGDLRTRAVASTGTGGGEQRGGGREERGGGGEQRGGGDVRRQAAVATCGGVARTGCGGGG